MPSWFWILMWVLVIAVVAFLAVREIRPGGVAPLMGTAPGTPPYDRRA